MSITELLLYVLIFAGVMLFNYLMRRPDGRAPRRNESEPTAAPPFPLPEEALADYGWGRQPAPLPQAYEPPKVAVDITAAPIAAPKGPSLRLHPAARRLKTDRREQRHAIVLMTLLGPCRAVDPYDGRDRG